MATQARSAFLGIRNSSFVNNPRFCSCMMRTASPLVLHRLKGDPYNRQSRVKATRPLKISFNEKHCSLYACVHILFHWLAYVLSKSPRVLSQEQVHSFPLLNLNHDDENKRAASLMTVRELLLPAIRAASKGKKMIISLP
jgi:hypothetical protein